MSPRFFQVSTQGYWTAFKAPTGPYPVGVVRRELTDSSRAARGPIVATIWYPAQEWSDVPPAHWYEDEVVGWLAANINPGLSILSEVYSHAAAELPVSRDAPWPAVVYSHGYQVLRSENTSLMIELSSHGYICVAIDHVDARISFQDGRGLVAGSGSFNIGRLRERVDDVRFVFDQLAEWQAQDSLFAGRVDVSKLGTLGWSFGGEAALEVARMDARCRATLSLDPSIVSLNATSFAKPALILFGGLWDADNDPVRSFYERIPSPAYFTQVQGTVHASFSSWLSAAVPELSTGFVDNQRAAQLVKTYTTSFFDKHLKGKDDGLLDDTSPEYPELVPFLRK
jgi:dienelactone hydrolase